MLSTCLMIQTWFLGLRLETGLGSVHGLQKMSYCIIIRVLRGTEVHSFCVCQQISVIRRGNVCFLQEKYVEYTIILDRGIAGVEVELCVC